MQRILVNFYLALEGVASNQLRAILTALGIVFGVAAVIAMMAIGSGAKQAILDQMKLVGTNNIVITSVENVEQEDEDSGTDQKNQKPWSPGLTLKDAEAIQRLIPTVETASPEIILSVNAVRAGKMHKAKCVGIDNDFFALNNLKIAEGKFFHWKQMEGGSPVCIIGKSIQSRFFSQSSPLGKRIKCGNTWLTIIGVLERRIASSESLENLGIRDYNADIYIPVSTALLRFKNRAVVNKSDISSGDNDNRDKNKIIPNYHQLDRLVVRVKQSEFLEPTTDVIARMLKRRHHKQIDYEIEVPELLLQQQQKTQETFNLVLAVIAGISLLVGGIGIMNIMLASVLERIKEIGLRRSLGANQQDIILQFLFEAIFISLIGGLIGVILGVTAATTISSYAEIPTIISSWSIVLSFGVAASVGLVFGLLPARSAARLDPIKALRSD